MTSHDDSSSGSGTDMRTQGEGMLITPRPVGQKWTDRNMFKWVRWTSAEELRTWLGDPYNGEVFLSLQLAFGL
jgi:hypothetical protein